MWFMKKRQTVIDGIIKFVKEDSIIARIDKQIPEEQKERALLLLKETLAKAIADYATNMSMNVK